MEKEFIPYEQALELKELGFNEPCFGNFADDEKHTLFTNGNRPGKTNAPTFSQAFRWFREKYSCVCEIIRKEVGNHSEFIGWVYIDDRKIDVVSYWDSKSYEEAELECLKKLIEIVKKTNNMAQQTAVEWLFNKLLLMNPNLLRYGGYLEQAKQTEKEQIKKSFVECWKANVPEGVECKLDAEQYYNETYGK